MSKQIKSQPIRVIRSLFVFLVLFGAFGTRSVVAQSLATPPGTGILPASDSTNTQITNQGNLVNIVGGTTAGNNLFHSFSQFGLSAGQVANFQSTSNIQNILGRVTGGNPSIINGQLQVTGSNANLFLINPAGMIFGPNAQLNLPAAFTATTANGIRFGDNQWFSSLGSNSLPSLVGNPTGYAFAVGPGGTIVNSGNLSATNLTLLGGTVINTGTLTSNGGTITVQSVPGGKLVRITDNHALLSLDLPLETQFNLPFTAPRSLPQLLTGGNIPEAKGLTVQNGIVHLSATQTPVATTAGTTTIAGNINANGSHNGGRIQINGEKTFIAANLSATGGNGKGGIIDTSGKSLTIAPTTQVNTLSKTGKTGTWLLDPINLEVIAPGASSNADSVIQGTTLEANLASTDVTLQADNNITISTALNASNGKKLRLEAPTIVLNDPIRIGVGNLSGTATAINVGGNGSIYNAVDVAAVNALVTLSPTLYRLQPEVGQGEIKLLKPITIQGTTQGLNQTTIDSGNTVESVNKFRIFNVGTITASLRDLIIQNGVSETTGGAIYNSGTLNLDRVKLQNNRAGNDGGALYNASNSIANINNSTLKNNTALDDGGAITNQGTMTVLNSTLSSNISEGISSSVSGGGGILNTTGATLTIRNSTISGNSAKVGGGIRNDGALTLDSNTIVNNSATRGGGGIVNTVNPVSSIAGRTTIRNTIVAQNNAPIAPDASGNPGSFTDEGHNLIGVRESFNSPIAATTQSGTTTSPLNPNLAPLANYGGLTETHDLHLGSAALNTGLTTLTTDQRGKTRSGLADIGAFESSGFRLKIGSDNNLTAVVNTAFQPLNLQVEAIDALEPVKGMIAVTVASIAGSTNAGFNNTTPQTINIDASGKGSISGSANTIAGSHAVSATATGLEGTANFNLLNLADIAARITALSGSDQTTIVNTPFSQQLEAKVTDQFGNPIANTLVNFIFPDSGPSAIPMIPRIPHVSFIFSGSLGFYPNEQGIATLPIYANGLDGAFVVMVKINGIPATAQFKLINQPIVNLGTNNPIPNNPNTNNPNTSSPNK